jgi:serine/threonine protein kinase
MSRSQTTFGDYRLIAQIGQGGMAQVWNAERRTLSGGRRRIVVKTLHPRLAHDRRFVQLFVSEARITAQLSHDGIAHVHDFGVVDGVPFIAMERVDGVGLNTLLSMLPRGRRLPTNVSSAICHQLCQVLGYLHGLRVIHGDVSPSNVMVRRDGGVNLIDFGVARVGSALRGAHENLVFGKCSYVAPEMLLGESDQRADVFSAGVVLYELLTGSRLFHGRNDQDTLDQVMNARIAFPSVVSAAVTPALDAVVMRALSRDPDGRFASAAEMASALAALQGTAGQCSRDQLAAFVRAHLDLPHVGGESEPATSPIAPSLSSACRARAMAALREAVQPIDEPAPRSPNTATVLHRPRPPRVRTSRWPRLMCAAAALVLTLLFPFTSDRLGWHRSDPAAAGEPVDSTATVGHDPRERCGLRPFERFVYHAPHATPGGPLKHASRRLRSRR